MTASYTKGHVPTNGKMSRHIQFEANMSLTGANADTRVPATPSQQLQILKALTGGSYFWFATEYCNCSCQRKS